MATEAQIAANQANAKLSSGPTTEAAKAASSKNHVIHGLPIEAACSSSSIGFESQKRKQEEHDRKQEQHRMKKDIHQWAVTLAEAKVYPQQTLTDSVKTLQDIAKLKANS